MENQQLIIINIILSTIIPIIANSLQECWRFVNRIKNSKCCGNEIIINDNPIKDIDKKV